MEMEFRDTSARRRRLLLYLGVALAFLAALMAYSMATQGLAAQEPPKMQAVLVATRDIPARTTLSGDDVTVRELPQDPALVPALTSPDQVLGRVSTVPMFSGQVIYPNTMITPIADAAFSILGPAEIITDETPDWRAVSVMVPPDRAVGGSIMSGQRVDLLVSVDIQIKVLDEDGNWVDQPTAEGFLTGKSTRIAIKDLEVLDVKPNEGIYILKVDAHQAEEIYHVASVAPGAFSLALRADGDTRPLDLDGYGETTDRLVMEYLFPVPRLLDLVELTNGEAAPPDGQPRVPAQPAPDPDQPAPEPDQPAPPTPAPVQPEPTPQPQQPDPTPVA
jgi:Flp pilus assembly protein CpaB